MFYLINSIGEVALIFNIVRPPATIHYRNQYCVHNEDNQKRGIQQRQTMKNIRAYNINAC